MQASLRQLLTCAALFAPGLALAEESILTRPADCKPVMTIQKRSCEVETQLRCGDGASEYWRVELADIEGPSSVTTNDSAHNLIRFESIDGNMSVFADPAQSFADLPQDIIASGHGAMAQIGMISVMGIRKPVSIRAEIASEPDEVLISGRRFHRFDAVYLVQLPPPMPLIHGTGKTYFDAVTGVLFEGEQQMEWPKDDDNIPSAPAAIILPGETGFDQPYPTYDCGQVSMNLSDEKANRS